MKKTVLMLLMALSLILPTKVFAEKIDISKYTTLNLEETLKDEQSYNSEFSYDITGYSENDNQVPIYLFRGKGCSHCEDFLTYLGNDLVKNYGSYFKLVSFETWSNNANSQLLSKVADFFGEVQYGVPFIVIGDQHFSGYAEELNGEIEEAIMTLYNSKEKDRYDIFEEMGKEETTNEKSSSASIIWNIIITSIGVLIVIAYNNYTKNEILNALNKKGK